MACLRGIVAVVYAAAFVVACGSSSTNNSAPATDTGAACSAASQCYAGLDAGALHGAAICLTNVSGGYCTHACGADSDCCAVAGECTRAEVCAPFESTGGMDCFLSCEAADLSKTTFTDGDAYCAHYASAAFTCRSTGGGANNRKVCLPS